MDDDTFAALESSLEAEQPYRTVAVTRAPMLQALAAVAITAVLLIAWLGLSAPLVLGLALGFFLCVGHNVRDYERTHAFEAEDVYGLDEFAEPPPDVRWL